MHITLSEILTFVASVGTTIAAILKVWPSILELIADVSALKAGHSANQSAIASMDTKINAVALQTPVPTTLTVADAPDIAAAGQPKAGG